jgi:hypothetical protein
MEEWLRGLHTTPVAYSWGLGELARGGQLASSLAESFFATLECELLDQRVASTTRAGRLKMTSVGDTPRR